MISIVDYGAGNLRSVKNALEHLRARSRIICTADNISNAKGLILPGDGSFGYMMKNLEKTKLTGAIREFISGGKPFLGICLGMQALFEESEESPGVAGLKIFRGSVIKFRKGKIPQIGWNKISPKNSTAEYFSRSGYVYFVNSYHAVPYDKSIIACTSAYNGTFVSAIKRRNITAVQFHPEKSGKFGLMLLKGWTDEALGKNT